MEARHFPYQHPTFGTVKNPATPDAWEGSVYYWWWVYLKRNKTYGPDHNLYSDFGDLGDEFKEWWREHGMTLFSEPRRDRVLCKVDGQIAKEDLANPDLMFVMVPMYLPSRDINKRFGDLLKKHHEGKQGVRAARSSLAKYPVTGQPNIPALALTLKVYDYRLAYPDMTLWEIHLALNPHLLRSLNEGPPADIPDKKMGYASMVSRYCRKAEAMIRNVGLGRFPDIN